MSHVYTLARRMHFGGEDPTTFLQMDLSAAPPRLKASGDVQRGVAVNLVAARATQGRGFQVTELRASPEEVAFLNQYRLLDESGESFKLQPGDNIWVYECGEPWSVGPDGSPMCGKAGKPSERLPSDAQHADKEQPGTYVAIDDVRKDQVQPALAYLSKENIRGARIPGGVQGGEGDEGVIARAREAYRMRSRLAELHTAQMKLYRESSAAPTNVVYTTLESAAKLLAESAQPAALVANRFGSTNRFGLLPAAAPAAGLAVAEAPAALAITVEAAAAFPWTAVIVGGVVIVVAVSMAVAIIYLASSYERIATQYAKAEEACADSVAAALAVVQDPAATPRDKAVAQEYIDFSVKKGCAKRLKPPPSFVDYAKWGLYGLAGISGAYLLFMAAPAISAASKESARKTKAKGQAVTQAKAQVQAISMARIEAQAKAKVQAEAKAKAQLQAKAQAESRAKAQAQVKAEVQAKAKAQAEARVKAQSEAKAKAQAQIHGKAEAQAKAKAELFAKAQAQAQDEAKTHAKAKAQAERQAKGSFNFTW